MFNWFRGFKSPGSKNKQVMRLGLNPPKFCGRKPSPQTSLHYKTKLTNYELRITNYELRITNYELFNYAYLLISELETSNSSFLTLHS